MKTEELAFLDALAGIAAHGTSYIQGEAAEIEKYLFDKIAEKQRAQIERAKPVDFLHDGEQLAITGVELFGNDKAKNLVKALVKTAQDGEQGKFMALIPDAITDFNAIKAFKK